VVENEFRNSRVTCGELEQRLIRAEQEIARQQKVAEETAGEICRLRKGTDCKPPAPDPANPVPDPANPVPDPANPVPAPVSSVTVAPAQ